jgi:tetratricopeptide (TPR) repeat protein
MRLRRSIETLIFAAMSTLAASSTAQSPRPSNARPPSSAPPDARAPQSGRATDGDSEALELFHAAAQRFNEGRFAEAADLLREAYRKKPDPLLLYNLGRACEGMGDLACARDAYVRYLDGDPSSPDRGAVTGRIETLKKQIEQQQAAQRDARRPAAPAPTPRSPSPVPWVVAGAGVLCLGAGVVFGVLTKSRHDAAPNQDSQQAALDVQAEADRYATVANVLFVAGAAITTVGVVWTIFDLRATAASSRRSVSLLIAPAGASVVVRH